MAIKKVLEMTVGLPDSERAPICVCTDSLAACLALTSADYMSKMFLISAKNRGSLIL